MIADWIEDWIEDLNHRPTVINQQCRMAAALN
jgi:hypothetical protein